MKVKLADCLTCSKASCGDVADGFVVPNLEVETDKIQVVMITEAPPREVKDYFYENSQAFYFQTIAQAFRDAGKEVASMQDILNMGVYVTTAIKCPKVRYSVPTDTIKCCSEILGKEIELFPNAKVYMLMGDVAIKSLNYIAKTKEEKRVIPNIATYKIRQGEYFYKDIRVFPSYIITGGNFLIEKSKREMVAEDIARMFTIISSK